MSESQIVVAVDNRKLIHEPDISAAVVAQLLDAGIPVKGHTCGGGITVERGMLTREHDCNTQASVYTWTPGVSNV